MPQNSAIYAVSRIRSRERSLIDRETVKRMSEGTAEEAWRMLTEMGYGAKPDAEYMDSEALIESELERTNALIKEVTTDERLTDIFFLGADATNLKLFLKRRLTGADAGGIYAHGGLYESKELMRMVQAKDYKPLPEKMAAAMDRAEAEIAAGRIDPARISTIIDQGYIDHALASGNAFVTAYFKATCDFDNLIAMARMKALGADEKRLEALLLTGGDIDPKAIVKAYQSHMGEGHAKSLPAGEMKAELQKALEEYAQSGDAAALERARDNALMRLASRGKGDIDTIAPVIGFLLAKRQEAKVVRLIMTALRNRLGADVIAERMRMLYGE